MIRIHFSIITEFYLFIVSVHVRANNVLLKRRFLRRIATSVEISRRCPAQIHLETSDIFLKIIYLRREGI